MNLKFEEIAEIMKIIDSSSCDELIVETGDVKLVVRRNGGPGPAQGLERLRQLDFFKPVGGQHGDAIASQ